MSQRKSKTGPKSSNSIKDQIQMLLHYCSKEKMRNSITNMSSQCWICCVRFQSLCLFAYTFSNIYKFLFQPLHCCWTLQTLMSGLKSLGFPVKVSCCGATCECCFFGEFGLQIVDNQTVKTLDGLLQVTSSRCPVRTLLTQVNFLKLITAFSSFFSATDFIDNSSNRLC